MISPGKPLHRGNLVGERSRSSGSKTPQIAKLPSARGEMVCSRRPMNYQYFVMLKLPWLSSLAAAASMSMPTTGIQTHIEFSWSQLFMFLTFFFSFLFHSVLNILNFFSCKNGFSLFLFYIFVLIFASEIDLLDLCKDREYDHLFHVKSGLSSP